MTALRHVALSFNDGADKTKHARVRGGKGMSLAEMASLGLPVPPGFTLATGISRAHIQHGRLPKRAVSQIQRELQALEARTGRRFGDPDHPLLVSVRSGAEISMPGMMDTILNVGVNPACQSGLVAMGGEPFARDIQKRFASQWLSATGQQIVPTDPNAQLMLAIEAVLLSWSSERAVAFRQANGIPHDTGTAVNVQQMVFGNMDQTSCTGVVFSADPLSGAAELFGEFLVQAQGEDVVSGTSRTRPIAELSTWNEPLARELEMHATMLEAHLKAPVDVEFTVEKGVLYLLQVRPVKLTQTAQIVHAVQGVWRAPRTQRERAKQRLVDSFPPSKVAALLRPTLGRSAATAKPATSGVSASPGAVVGIVARTIKDAKERSAQGDTVVLVRGDTSPHDLPGMLASSAIVTGTGGPSCHAAIVARDIGIPAVVSAADIDVLTSGMTVTVSGDTGCVYAGSLPLETTRPPYEAKLLSRWIKASERSEPQLNLKLLTQRISSATLLADVYLTEAMAEAARETSMEIEAIKLRTKTHRLVAEWIATYLLLAISAEARHYWTHTTITDDISAKAAIYVDRRLCAKKFGTPDGRKPVQERAVAFAAQCTPEKLRELVESITIMFDQPQWQPGFGGKKWAAIAECLLRFLSGKISHSVFADQAFDLRHNGDRLFDKHETIKESSCLIALLDTKKACSTPAALRAKCHQYGEHPSPTTEALWRQGVQKGLWKEAP